MTTRIHPRLGRSPVTIAVLAIVLAGCGSAQDLADDLPAATGATSAPTTTPSTSPPTTAAPTPTPTPSVAPLPKAGQCRSIATYDLATRVSRSTSPAVSCSTSHTGQTYAARTLSGAQKAAAGAPASKVLETFRGYCERTLTTWLRTDISELKRSQFDFVVGLPPASDVAGGAAWVRCDVFVRNGLTQAATLPASTRAALRGDKGQGFLTCVKGDISTASGTVPCASTHRWKGVSSVKLGATSKRFPGTGSVRSTMKSRCGADVRAYLDTRGAFRYGYIVPTRLTWQRGDRYGVCFANTRT